MVGRLIVYNGVTTERVNQKSELVEAGEIEISKIYERRDEREHESSSSDVLYYRYRYNRQQCMYPVPGSTGTYR